MPECLAFVLCHTVESSDAFRMLYKGGGEGGKTTVEEF